MSDNPTNWQYQTTISTSFGQGRPSGLERDGCCATWPKPCSYHEGYQDALDTFEQVGWVSRLRDDRGRPVAFEVVNHQSDDVPVWVRRG